MFVGQQRQGHGKLFFTSSLSNDLHSALTPIPLRATEKKLCLFCKLKNEEIWKLGEKRGGDRGGEEDSEGGGER